jgi:hypothetical protein
VRNSVVPTRMKSLWMTQSQLSVKHQVRVLYQSVSGVIKVLFCACYLQDQLPHRLYKM